MKKFKSFIALDLKSNTQNISIVKKLYRHVYGFKIGYRSFYNSNSHKLISEIRKKKSKLFLDLKLHDIPNTVKQSLKNVLDLSPNYVTVHLSGGLNMLEELAEMKKKTKIIGVSMLTNLDNHDLKRMGFSCGHKKFVENLVFFITGRVLTNSDSQIL